jgi:hypothetical protein
MIESKGSISTELTLGCENCPNRQTLLFELGACAVLFGTNTTNLPGKVVEKIWFDVGVATGQISSGYDTVYDSDNDEDLACAEDACVNTERITSVAQELTTRVNQIRALNRQLKAES